MRTQAYILRAVIYDETDVKAIRKMKHGMKKFMKDEMKNEGKKIIRGTWAFTTEKNEDDEFATAYMKVSVNGGEKVK